MTLADELGGIAASAAGFAEDGEEFSGVLAAEPLSGERVYLCAFESGGARSWIALDGEGRPLEYGSLVREGASIAALCEFAAEVAGGGRLEELRAELLELRLTEGPAGIEEAEEAALALERTIGSPPRVATPALLDEIGAATRRLELALGGDSPSPFAEAMKGTRTAVDELVREIERGYKGQLP